MQAATTRARVGATDSAQTEAKRARQCDDAAVLSPPTELSAERAQRGSDTLFADGLGESNCGNDECSESPDKHEDTEWPTPSRLGRDRVLKVNKSTSGPPIGARTSRKIVQTNANLVAKCMKEHPNQTFSNIRGVLFCQACKAEVNHDKTTADRHVESEKHCKAVQRLLRQQDRHAEMAVTIDKWFDDTNAQGAQLATSTLVYRMSLLNAFLHSGIPLSRLEYALLHDFLRDFALGAPSRSVLSNMIPCAKEHEVGTVRKELKGKELMIVFDGTTHVAEVCCIIVRWIDDDFTPQQRIVHLGFYERAFRHGHIVAMMNQVVRVEFQIDYRCVRAFQRDRASVNSAAMERLRDDFPLAEDLACLSHTLDNCGHHFDAPALEQFFNNWNGLFARSTNIQGTWRDVAGSSFPTKSPTRWWSEYDCFVYLLEHEQHIPLFLAHDDHNQPGALMKHLRRDWQNPLTRAEILLQLTATVEIGKIFRDATYKLEGDGALSLIAYDELLSIETTRTTVFAPMEYPQTIARTEALARQLVALNLQGLPRDANVLQRQLLANAQTVGSGAFQYFTSRVWNGALANQVELYKAIRLCNPQVMMTTAPTAQMVRATLQRARSMCDVDLLITELAQYQALAAGLPAMNEEHLSLEQLTRFWQGNQARIPGWAAFTKRGLLMQPSSAAPERAFSMLNNTFRDDRNHALEDYVATSVMLQYNENFRRRNAEVQL